MIKTENNRTHRSVKYIIRCLLPAVLMLLSFSPEAFPHRVNIFAWVEENRVYTQSKFVGGKAPHKAKVSVFDPTGTRILEGETDSHGEFSFPIEEKIPMRIVLDAGNGHQAVWILTKDDFQDTTVLSTGAGMTETARSATADALPETKQGPDPHNGAQLSEDEIRVIVEETLDRKLKPLMRLLIESRTDNITLTDILGGIGYIVGLIGLAAYMNYRGKKE